MARDPELRQLFDGIQAEEAEMHGYRDSLRSALPRRRGLFVRPLFAVLPLAAAMVLALWLMPADPFAQNDASTFYQWASNQHADSLLQEAETILASAEDSSTRALNAKLAYILASEGESAIYTAADGLLSEPRAAGRAIFLEYLLDYGDEYRYNVELLEARMDVENDRFCFDLFEKLLAIAEVG